MKNNDIRVPTIKIPAIDGTTPLYEAERIIIEDYKDTSNPIGSNGYSVQGGTLFKIDEANALKDAINDWIIENSAPISTEQDKCNP